MAKKNLSLNKAKSSKYDEFYIIKSDVYKTLSSYQTVFAGKNVYCNTDDYRISNIWKVFYENFSAWNLKSLTATGFNKKGRGVYAHYDGSTLTVRELNGNGDFRSKECVDILHKCDICVTCPPFSLNREFLHLMYDSGKQYLTLSHLTVCTYQWVIERLANREMTRSLTTISNTKFTVPSDYTGTKKLMKDGTYQTSINCIWLTNIITKSFHYENLKMKKQILCEYEFITTKSGEKVLFPKSINDIPVEYEGKIRLPITCVNFINPMTGNIEAEFESSVSFLKQNIKLLGNEEMATGDYRFYSDDGKKKFPGLVVEKKMF